MSGVVHRTGRHWRIGWRIKSLMVKQGRKACRVVGGHVAAGGNGAGVAVVASVVAASDRIPAPHGPADLSAFLLVKGGLAFGLGILVGVAFVVEQGDRLLLIHLRRLRLWPASGDLALALLSFLVGTI